MDRVKDALIDVGRGAVTEPLVPGELRPRDGSIALNEERETTTLRVGNGGDRPVQVGSHFHFFEANAALQFDRPSAFGMRLNIPAGTAVRFEPGDEKTVDLVEIGGERHVYGMNGLTNGPIDDASDRALERARERGFVDDDSGGDGSAQSGGSE